MKELDEVGLQIFVVRKNGEPVSNHEVRVVWSDGVSYRSTNNEGICQTDVASGTIKEIIVGTKSVFTGPKLIDSRTQTMTVVY